jgi:hypothetical protein
MTTPDNTRYTVIVTLPTGPDAPEGLDPVRRVGPYNHKHSAETAIAAFGMMVASSAPTGTTFELVAYDKSLPHLDPYPPTSPYELAEAIRVMPSGDGGWTFPDLYARLSAGHGAERASKAWRLACAYLDAEELDAKEAATEDEQREAAEQERERLALLRRRVDRLATVTFAGWYAAPCRDLAVRLADAMLTAAAKVHPGATLDEFDNVTGIVTGCFDVASTLLGRRRAEALPAGRAAELLDLLVVELAARHIAADRRGYTVVLRDRPGPVMSRWRYPLLVALHSDPAWDIMRDVPSGPTRAAHLYSTFDDEGVRGVADLIAECAAGNAPDPFADR